MTIRISRRGVLAGSAGAATMLAAPTVWGQSINRERVILAMTQEPVQFNPLLYVNAGTENVPEACLFDALWDVNDKGEFFANLAAQVPTRQNGGISADGLTWTVNLKRDVKWSDGQPFTAKDVEFTYQTIMNPAVAVRSRSGFDLIKAFRVKDDFTIEMELSKPFVPFLWAWQNMHIVPQHILGREANIQTSGFNSQPIGTGAFTLRSRTAGSHMVYERNPNYHRGPAKLRQFIHKFVPDQMSAYGQARTGEVDYFALSGVPNDRWTEARAFPDRDFLVYPTPNVQFIYFNCGKPQFADPRVRKALTMATQMQKSIDDIYFGTWPRTLSYLQPTHWAYNRDLRDYTNDPAGAERLLDEAGWRTRRGRHPRQGRRAVEVHHVHHRRQCRAAGLPGAVPAELEGDRRGDGNPQHARQRGVGRIHHAVALRHAAGGLGPDRGPRPRLHRALPFEDDPGEAPPGQQLRAVRECRGGPAARTRRDADRAGGSPCHLQAAPGDPA